jgi:hypothetical protein
MRAAVVAFLALAAALGFFAGKRLLYPTVTPQAASLTSPAAQAYLIALGVNDAADTVWDGSITVTGATVLSLQGWRFADKDAIIGTSGWTLSSRTSPPPPQGTAGPMQENGVIVTISAPTGAVTFSVKTMQGNFTFLSTDVPFGTIKPFLTGKARVTQTAAPFQLTSSNEEQDFPVTAQSGDDVYLVYTEFVHGDRSKAVGLSTKTTITDFTSFARPVGGDQVFLMH